MNTSKRNIIKHPIHRSIRVDSASFNTEGRQDLSVSDRDRLQWWSKARFGMFIHWGIYSVPAGRWKDKKIAGIAEWLMHKATVPVLEYERLASCFNPVQYDAEEWVNLARQAGAKYIVITSKHHDGFAIFDSSASDYNIVSSTPFARDPIKELAEACKKAGMKLGFYYSQDQDWHHPGGSGNYWDYPKRTSADFANYLEEKVKPQLRELLTSYGPISIIWFDTPYTISHDQSVELQQLVNELQPDCLVSGRIGNGVGDYGSLSDNQIPIGQIQGFWETPATMNDTWGFKQDDNEWKSVDTLIELLAELASRGVNYLLNVGPTDQGIIPKASVDRMEAIGRWMEVNGEAIYETQPSPFPSSFDWGNVTVNRNKLYLLIKDYPSNPFVLHGLRSKVIRVYMLSDPKSDFDFKQLYDDSLDHDVLEIIFPNRIPDQHVPVVVLELDGEPKIDNMLLQQPNGTATLVSTMANLHNKQGTSPINITPSGVAEDWTNKSNWMSWKVKIVRPGDYEISLVTGGSRHNSPWDVGHRVNIEFASQSFRCVVSRHVVVTKPRAQYFPEAETKMGKVKINQPGTYDLKLFADHIQKGNSIGLSVVSVQLRPV